MIPVIFTIILSAFISSKVRPQYGWLTFAMGNIIFILPVSYIYLGTVKYISELNSEKIMNDATFIIGGLLTNIVYFLSGKEYNIALAIAGVITVLSSIVGAFVLMNYNSKIKEKHITNL